MALITSSLLVSLITGIAFLIETRKRSFSLGLAAPSASANGGSSKVIGWSGG